MSAAAADDRSAYGPAATAARERSAAVNFMLELEKPDPAFGILVVPDGRTAPGHGPAKNAAQTPPQTANFFRAQAGGGNQGMEPRREQDLIGIDVADTGQKALVEKQALQTACAAPDETREFVEADLKRFRAKTLESAFLSARLPPIQSQPAEFSHIPEAEVFAPSGETEDKMGVPVARPAGWTQQELSGHLEMKDQARSILQGDDQVFAPPAQLGHPKPLKPPQVGRPAALQHMPMKHAAAGDPPADEAAVQAPPNGLDLREFRHGGILAQIFLDLDCGLV